MPDVGEVGVEGDEGAGEAFDEEEGGEEVGGLKGLVLVGALEGVFEEVG